MARVVIVLEDKIDGSVEVRLTPPFSVLAMMAKGVGGAGSKLTRAHVYATAAARTLVELSRKAADSYSDMLEDPFKRKN